MMIFLHQLSNLEESPVKVAIAPARDPYTFRVTVSNERFRPIAVCKYPQAWWLDLYAGSRRITDEDAFRNGGVGKDGTLYHPPQLLLQTSLDWVLLRPGETISFVLTGVTLGGKIRESARVTKAVVRLVPKELEPPDWTETRRIPVLGGDVVATWVRPTPKARTSDRTTFYTSDYLQVRS